MAKSLKPRNNFYEICYKEKKKLAYACLLFAGCLVDFAFLTMVLVNL